MKTNENSPQTSPRLSRIQLVSRIVRYAVLGCLVLAIVPFLFCFWWTPSPSWSVSYLLHPLLMIPMQAVLCLWYWKLAKLFHFYERGLIFAAETIRCIQTLGFLCVINWLL